MMVSTSCCWTKSSSSNSTSSSVSWQVAAIELSQDSTRYYFGSYKGIIICVDIFSSAHKRGKPPRRILINVSGGRGWTQREGSANAGIYKREPGPRSAWGLSRKGIVPGSVQTSLRGWGRVLSEGGLMVKWGMYDVRVWVAAKVRMIPIPNYYTVIEVGDVGSRDPMLLLCHPCPLSCAVV